MAQIDEWNLDREETVGKSNHCVFTHSVIIYSSAELCRGSSTCRGAGSPQLEKLVAAPSGANVGNYKNCEMQSLYSHTELDRQSLPIIFAVGKTCWAF
jgi:hypothetical protein